MILSLAEKYTKNIVLDLDLKLRNEQSNIYISLLKEGVLTYEQLKDLGILHKI